MRRRRGVLDCLSEVGDWQGDPLAQGGHLMRPVNDATEEVFMVEDMVRDVINDDELDRLMDRIDADGLELLGPEGVSTGLTSRIMNRAMQRTVRP